MTLVTDLYLTKCLSDYCQIQCCFYIFVVGDNTVFSYFFLTLNSTVKSRVMEIIDGHSMLLILINI